MLVGPNSPIGNISIIDVSETLTRYALDCIRRIEGTGRSDRAPARGRAGRLGGRTLPALQLGKVG